MEEVKLCIKCRYCKRTKATYYRHQYECLHPNRMIVNLVTGEQLTEFYCDTFRQFDIDCGKEGLFDFCSKHDIYFIKIESN